MPVPGQQGSDIPGQMPVPAMATSAAGMAAGPGRTAAAQSQMHPPGMHDGEAALPRFRPSNLPPGTPAPAVFEPGVVEVQFREGLRPAVADAGPEAPSEILSQAGIALTELNQILRRHQMVKAEPTFNTTHEEATAAQATARLQGINAPHLAHFITFHFPATSDVNLIANELNQLAEVEIAVPVPRAIPPGVGIAPVPAAERAERTSSATAVAVAPTPVALAPASPLADPLVGNSDQVVVDPVTSLEHQWYIFRCHANEAWSRASGDGVVIADVDWGCRTSHQDLAADIERTYNAFDGGADITQGGSVFHGTGVLGLTGAAANGVGMTGFGYGARLWPIQADSGPGPSLGGNAWARGIDWVRTTDSGGRRKVVILEVQTGAFGNYEQVPSVNAAIQTAIGAGVVVCVAAGNGDRDAGIDDSGNPIPATGSILVGATAYDPAQNPRAWFSNYGPRITVCAPGDGSHDVTCDNASDTAYRNNFGGTSGATPKVAGTVALMLSANPNLTHAQIRTILNLSGGPVVTDPGKPVGTFLNANAAVREARVGVAGRLEVFARGADRALWHIWQTAPNNGWSGWDSLGGWIDRVELARNADGRLEVFARGADGAVWHNWQTAPNNGWSGWASMGGWVDIIEVAQNSDGRLEVFARGADGAVWHNWQTAPNNGWSGWASMGGWVDLIEVAQNADGRLEIFARGADGAVWHNWQTAPSNDWSGWASMGGWVDIIEVGQNEDGRLEVFARGSDGAVWHNWQTAPNNGWSGWASLGGWVDLIEVAENQDGRLEVFVRGADGAVWHNWQTAPNNGWSGWASMGGWIDRLEVDPNADSRLEIFARGADGALWHNWQTAPNNGWSGWASMGGWIDLIEVAQNAGA
jgi:subtilisin family serine protease